MAGPDPQALEEARRLERTGRAAAAARAFLEAGAFPDAARILVALGRTADAARALSDGGLFLEAAQLLADAGDAPAALDRLVRMPARDPRYRAAARRAVALAASAGALNVRFEQFVGAFIDAGPQDEEEGAAFRTLGDLYVRLGMPENAEEVFSRAFERDPDDSELARRLEVLRGAALGDDGALAGLLGDDERFRRVASGGGARDEHTTVLAGDLHEPPGGRVEQPAPAAVSGTAASVFLPGSVIAERYRLEAEIGRGGMATVYEAQDLELSESVALKVFRPMPQDEEGIARFRQELKVSRRLIHPNITRLYDIGVYEGHRYISMELLVGQSLDRLSGTRWPTRRGIDCLKQVCEGLNAAHVEGVIHRDIKPGNLFLTREGIAKVMDFGIARERAAPGVTQAGMIVGTPEYMSPEQIAGADAGDASDLYALGIVAYEMFTGRKPFVHDNLVALLQMHLVTPPEPPRRHVPQLPAALETVILTLLKKEPRERFPSARATADALAAIGDTTRV